MGNRAVNGGEGGEGEWGSAKEIPGQMTITRRGYLAELCYFGKEAREGWQR